MSVRFATQSLGDTLIKQAKADVHPPFYYLLLNLWVKAFGKGEFEVRLLSAIFGILSILSLYFIVKDLFGNLLALISALILSLSPFHVYYSQEARMYSLVTFLVLLSMFFMVKIAYLDKEKRELGKTMLYSLGYIISTALALYSHNIALFLPIAQTIFLVIFWKRHKTLLKIWTSVGLLILLLWLPWFSSFLKQGLSVKKNFYAPPLSFDGMVSLFATFNNGPSYWLFNWIDTSYISIIHGRLVLITLIFFGFLFLIGIFYMRHNTQPLVFLLLIFLVPVGAEILISIKHSILTPQTLIWASVPYYVLVAAGITAIRGKWAFALVLGFVSIFSLASLYKYYTDYQKERWDLAARYVANNSSEEDLVLFSSSLGQIPFEYYFEKYGIALKKHGLPVDFIEKKMTLGNLSRLENLIQNQKRVWLIYSHEWFTDPKKLSKKALEERYCLVKEKSFKSSQLAITCYLFESCKL
jgi:4-amino-4-deoxy-L-arabinose transferase-like glycosyltransferase